MRTELGSTIFFPPFIKREAKILDSNSEADLKKASELLSKGEAIISAIDGVMGFICDGTQSSGVEQIYHLKDRQRSKQLINAASASVRSRLIDWDQVHPFWRNFYFGQIYQFPVFVKFPASRVVARDFVQQDKEGVNTVAIWWGNYNPWMPAIETGLLKLRPEAYLGGSSCNRSSEESIEDSETAFKAFGRGEDRVAAIIRCREYDKGRGLIHGSQTMFQITGDKLVAQRSGSVHSESLRSVLGERLVIPEGFHDNPDARILDARQLALYKDYFVHS